MPRTQYRVYQMRRKKHRFSLLLLAAAAAALVLGLHGRSAAFRALTAEPRVEPTATPVAPLFDETPAERDYTVPETTWFALQTGLYTDSASAAQVACQFTDRGAPGYVLAQNGKYRVLIAAYGNQAEADAMRARLSRHQGVETVLYRWTGEDVTLHLSGMAGQLDAAEAGLTLLYQTAPAMRDLAVACDLGEYTRDEACSMLSSVLTQLDLWESTVRSRFAKPYPPLISELISVCGEAIEDVRKAQSASTITDLSAGLKLQSMALYERLNALRSFLLGL